MSTTHPTASDIDSSGTQVTTIRFKRSTAAIWASVNPILLSGEPSYETDTAKWKIGDGTSRYNDLPYKTSSGGGGSTAWVDITGKPTTFAPSAHAHPVSEITGFQSAVSSNTDVAAIKAIVGAGITDGDTVVNTLAEMLAVFSTYQEGVNIATILTNVQNKIITGISVTGTTTKTATITFADNTAISATFSDLGGGIIDTSITSGSANAVSGGAVYTALASKQPNLVSGANIKTINGSSILGSGDVVISSSGSISIDTNPTSGSSNAVSSGGTFTGLSAKAPLASPAFTGNPTAVTQTVGDNSTKLATTAFVEDSLAAEAYNFGTTFQGNGSLSTPFNVADGSLGVVKLSATGTKDGTKFLRDDNTWVVPSGSGAGITDGDKGDVVVSSSGSVWTVDAGAITGSKIADGTIGITKISASGSRDTTTFLRGDGTFATPAGGSSVAGSTGQLQYNNAGALAGTAKITTDGGRISFYPTIGTDTILYGANVSNNDRAFQLRMINDNSAQLDIGALGSPGFMERIYIDGYGYDVSGFVFENHGSLAWSNNGNARGTADTAISRSAAGVVEVNNGTSGTLRDIKARTLIAQSTTTASIPFPKMTTSERDAIASPSAGMSVYDTTVNKVSIHDGTSWRYLVFE